MWHVWGWSLVPEVGAEVVTCVDHLGGGFEEEVDALVEEVAAGDAGDAGSVGADAGCRGGAERRDGRGTAQGDGADDGGVRLEGQASVRCAEAGHEAPEAWFGASVFLCFEECFEECFG